ncbi:glycosyltransferase [Solidesulfovibrio sp.]|uniref:glycosyltransferase n=1 Tax=Solidesulfovibrio sp. TaxID=2910990 RepID=UPI002614CFFB|nr:glycosyltransferase [Solidesulfovibrio sp.]
MQPDLTVLFVHKDFPSQFRGLLEHFLRRPGTRVAAIRDGAKGAPIPGVVDAPYGGLGERPQGLHQYARQVEEQIRRGRAAMEAAKALRRAGIVPDLVYAHPGWGEALFLKDVFPSARLIAYCEHYYLPREGDAAFDPEFPLLEYHWPIVTLQNTAGLLALAACDRGVSPTFWQRGNYPRPWQERIEVVHEGVDTDLVRPDPAARLRLDGLPGELAVGDEVVTYMARDLEPYRGFHVFMRCLPHLLRLRPRCRVLVVGREGASYGMKPPFGQSYAKRYKAQHPVDPNRVFFRDTLPYPDFLKVLQISACHVYLTYPFVLSWSVLEAMAAGCLLVGSDTPPVREVVADGENGFLTDFFDHEALAARIASVLEARDGLAHVRRAARETVLARYDKKRVCLPAHLRLAGRVLAGGHDAQA